MVMIASTLSLGMFLNTPFIDHCLRYSISSLGFPQISHIILHFCCLFWFFDDGFCLKDCVEIFLDGGGGMWALQQLIASPWINELKKMVHSKICIDKR
ncbi:hypothetical protein HanRHA438_Chr04g0160821 [Helianthus annuus]|nr:hypothetical protein HanRHA438_Chr04g0160821 [Helianthus annuus]